MKFIKRTFITLAVILLAIIGFIELSGNQYIYAALKATVFRGTLQPSIDNHTTFANRVVEAGNYQAWPVDSNYNTFELSPEELATHEQYQSIAVVVIKSGKLWFEKYWDGYSDSSKTNSWSMVKSMVAHLAVAAVQDGYIGSIHDQISKYIPMYEKDSITIESLLTMSSGISFDENYVNPFSYPARSLYDTDIKEIHKKYVSDEKAGVNYSYQSGNTQLLAFIVESATGKTVSEYASEKLWKPLGARYDALWSLDREGGMEKAFCCLNSNARDFARFGQLYLQKGVWNGDTLLEESYHQNVTKPANNFDFDLGIPNNRYSYGWWTVNYHDHSVYYCRGVNGQYIFVIPDLDMVYVRLGRKRDRKKRYEGHPVDVLRYLEQAYRMAEAAS